jgi:hypothetical protein
VIFVPAIAETLTLKQFAFDSMTIVRNGKVASVGGVNFDVAFYAPRDIPDVTLRQAETYEYLFCSQHECDLLPSPIRGHFVAVLTSGPTSLDGRGQIVLLRRVEPATTGATQGAKTENQQVSMIVSSHRLLHLGRHLELAGDQLASASSRATSHQ